MVNLIANPAYALVIRHIRRRTVAASQAIIGQILVYSAGPTETVDMAGNLTGRHNRVQTGLE